MPDQKISQLPSGTNAQAGDLFVIARSGANYSLTTAQLLSPTQSSNSATGLFLSNADLGSSATSRITFATQGGNAYIEARRNASGSLVFNVGAADRWVMNNSGHFLASTDNSIDIGASGANRPRDLWIGRNATISGNLTVDTDTLFVNATTNRVGVGTTSPGSPLEVAALSQTVSSGNAHLNLVSTDTAAADLGGVLVFSANTTPAAKFPVASISGRHQTLGAGNYSGYLQFSTTSALGGVTERMRITALGDVGIGTLIPSFWSARLAVDGGALALASGNRAVFWNTTGNGLASIQGVGVDVLSFQTGSSYTERMRIDASGNLGLGVTPSAWSGVGAVFQHPSVSISASSGGGTDTTAFTTNAIYNGTNWLYRTTALATRYDQWAGSHRWFTAPSGTAGATATFTMTWQINSSGHFLAGTDNTYDIGASGATRPRDVFVARNVVASGQGNFGNLVIGTVSATLSNVSTGMVGYADSHPTFGNGTLVLQARSSVARPIVLVTGATTGTARMSVKEDGQVRFVPLAAAPTTSVEDGDVYYDSGTNKLRVRAGGAWVDLH